MKLALCVVTLMAAGAALAQTQVPHEFQAGEPARAAEINENFNTLETAINQTVSAIDEFDASRYRSEEALISTRRLFQDLHKLSTALGLGCGEFATDNLYGCSQITTGNGTTIQLVGYRLASQLAITEVLGEFIATSPTPSGRVLLKASMVTIENAAVFGGSANFYRIGEPENSVTHLVDDCSNPTIGLVAKGIGNYAVGRWRVNNGGFYAAVMTETSAGVLTFVPRGEIDVTGQTLGIVRNLSNTHFANVSPDNPISWCEMSSQLTGIYDIYDLVPFSLNLTEPLFQPPYVIQ